MIQGVHAQTIVFTTYEHASSLVLAPGWPWIGTADQFGGREVAFRGTRPRRFRLRVSDARQRSKFISCRLELHDMERLFGPLIKVELSLAPEAMTTSITLTGSTVRELAPASSMQAVVSRRLANEYARSLLDQIADEMEKGSAASTPNAQSRTAAGRA